MERKVKTGMSALLIIGIVFSLLGACFLAAGIISYFGLNDQGFVMFSLIYGGIGMVFFVLGLIFLLCEIRKKQRRNKLINSGNYIMAEITEVAMDYSVRVNNSYPYIVKCMYQDTEGNIHIFKSRYLYFDPGMLLKEQKVKVYVDGENFKHYYVDIDEILPPIIQH